MGMDAVALYQLQHGQEGHDDLQPGSSCSSRPRKDDRSTSFIVLTIRSIFSRIVTRGAAMIDPSGFLLASLANASSAAATSFSRVRLDRSSFGFHFGGGAMRRYVRRFVPGAVHPCADFLVALVQFQLVNQRPPDILFAGFTSGWPGQKRFRFDLQQLCRDQQEGGDFIRIDLFKAVDIGRDTDR